MYISLTVRSGHISELRLEQQNHYSIKIVQEPFHIIPEKHTLPSQAAMSQS